MEYLRVNDSKYDISKILLETSFVNGTRRSKRLAEMLAPDEISDETFLVEDPLVSVLVLTYNHEKYIRECLDSIIAQRCTFNYEIVIAEDLSSDHTLDICREYQQRFKEKIRLLCARENGGGPFENAIRAARYLRGKYMCVCEADDYWCDINKIQCQTEFLEAHSDYSLVYSGLFSQYEGYKFTRRPYSLRTRRRLCSLNSVSQDQFAAMQLTNMSVSTQTSMYQTKLFQEQLEIFDDMTKSVGWVPVIDFPTFFLVSKRGRCHYQDRFMSVIRLNRNSLTAIRDRKMSLFRMLGSSRIALFLDARIPTMTKEDRCFKVAQMLVRYAQVTSLLPNYPISQYLRELALSDYLKLPAAEYNYFKNGEALKFRKTCFLSERTLLGSVFRKVIVFIQNLVGGEMV